MHPLDDPLGLAPSAAVRRLNRYLKPTEKQKTSGCQMHFPMQQLVSAVSEG